MQDKVCHQFQAWVILERLLILAASPTKLKTKKYYKICNHTGLNPTKAHIIILIMAFFGNFDLGNQNN